MRPAWLLTFLLAAGGITGAIASSSAGPRVAAQTPLSAVPAELAVGPAGPFNRIAFDIERPGPADAAFSVSCHYPGRLAYRCDAALAQAEPGGARRRLTVTIPDLGRGSPVVVRIADAGGYRDVPVELANVPQVVHEIEALALPGGGRKATGSDGTAVPVMTVVSERLTTTPALAAAAGAPACDRIYAEWVGATATDAVFQSAFGPLNGSVLSSRPVRPGTRVEPGNLPEWLVSYPLSASRVQFIAHYEVIYRVDACSQRVIGAAG